jgi:hypothetical protein
MIRRISALPLALLLQTSTCEATLISGFEDGLLGWEFLGDVSVQTNVIGAPTEGDQQAFITTLCDSRFVPWCEVSDPEVPYSGVSAIPAVELHGHSQSAAQFVGLPTDIDLFTAELPTLPPNAPVGESGAIKRRFYGTAGSLLSFDWRHYSIGGEGDSSYFTLWGEDPLDPFRLTDYLRHGGEGQPAHISGINLCVRVIGNDCTGSVTYDTGYLTRSLLLPSDGWYWLGFAMFEGEEGTVPSALSIDNLQLQIDVPEPEMGAMGLAGLLLLATISACPLARKRSR